MFCYVAASQPGSSAFVEQMRNKRITKRVAMGNSKSTSDMPMR